MSNVAAGKDTDDEGEKLNDVEKVLEKNNIKLRDSIGQWRNFEDVLDEVAEKWKSFTEIQRSQIATAIAGTRQQETFRALMNNYDQVANLADVAANSIGSASEKMEIYTDSVEAKTNELKATWEEFVMSLNQSESYKQFLDFLIQLIEHLPEVISLLGMLIAIFKGDKILSFFKNLGSEGLSNLKTMKDAIKSIFTSIKGGIGDFGAFISLVKETKGTAAGAKTTLGTLGKTISGLGLTGKVAAGGIGLLIAAIGIGISQYKKYKQAQVDAAKSTNEYQKEQEKEVESLEDVKKKYNDIINSTKSAKEKKQELSSLQEDLNSKFGEEKNAIDLVNGSYERQNDLLNDNIKKKRLEQQTEYQKNKDKIEGLLDDKTTNILARNASTVDSGLKSSIAGIAKRNGGTLSTTNGGGLRLDADGKSLVKIYKELTEYQQKLNEMGYTNQAEQLAKMFNYDNPIDGIASLQEDYEKFVDAYESKQNDLLNSFLINNQKEYDAYEDLLSKKYDLYEKYNKSTSDAEKRSLKTQIDDMENQVNDAYNKLYYQSDGVTQEIRSALDDKFLKYKIDFDISTIDWTQLGKNESGVDKLFKQINEEISKTGEISDDSKKKVYELYKLVYSSGEEGWINEFTEMLKTAGISVSGLKTQLDFTDEESNLKNYNDELNRLKKVKDDAQKEKNDASINDAIQKQLMEAIIKNNSGYAASQGYGIIMPNADEYDQASTDLKQAEENLSVANEDLQKKMAEYKERMANIITDAGLSTDAKWYQDLLKQFEIDSNAENFFNGIKDHLKKIGMLAEEDSDKIKTLVPSDSTLHLSKYGDYSAGTDSAFKTGVVDKVEDLKGIQNKISGGTAKYEDMRELVDSYDSLNDKVQKTGDIMSITKDDVQDVIDEIVDNVNDDLDKIINNSQRTMDEIENIYRNTLKSLKEYDEENATNLTEVFNDAWAEAAEAAEDAWKDNKDMSFIDPTIVSGNVDLVTEKIKDLQDAEDEATTYATMLDAALMFADDGTKQEMIDLLTTSMGDLSTQEWLTALNALSLDEELVQQMNQLNDTSVEAHNLFAEYGLVDEETGQLKLDSETLKNALPQLSAQFSNLSGEARNTAAAILSAAYSQGMMNNAINGATSEEIIEKSSKTLSTANTYARATKQEATVRKSGLKNVANGKLDGKKDKSSSSSKNSYTPEEAEKDKKSILNDIEDYERDIEADLEDQTEQLVNHYNLERNKLDTLREELDYYDAIYDSTENTTKWLETQLKILDEESKKVAEMQKSNDKIDAQRKKIYAENKQYNVESWFDSEGNDTLAYGNMLNDIEYKKEAIQRETAQKMRAEYNRIANSTDKDTISDAKEKIKLIEEEGDLKIKELDKEKEKIENIHDSVETLNDAWDENQEKIRESLQELNDRIKSVRDELIDDLMEQLERATDKMNKSIEKDVTRLEQLRQVQESYNSILNDTIDTQDELLDELQANLDSYQYLDEDMRQLMFNEDDYKKLSGVLGDIQEDIAGIWEDHYNQIQSLTEDEMYKAEYITAETERQLAAKQREYELAKAELDIAKAKTNLENVKNERNVRIFANGQWQWVADPNAVKDAQKQLADAEREKNRIEREAEQQELLDSLDRIIDADNLQIDKNNELLEKIQEAIEQETEEVKSIDDALQNIKDANLPELNTTLINALGADGGSMTELLKNINKNQSELAAALRGQTIDQAVQQLKSGTMNEKDFRELVTRLGYVFNDTTGKVTTQDGEFDAHYSGWSKKPNNDVQTTTGNNGVQVTGQNNSSSGASNSGNSNNSGNSGASNRKSNEEIAKEVWQGKWGNGQDRKNRLTAAGYDYNAVQKIVNRGRKYDSGGIANGIGLMVKDTLEPERVLSPKQTKSFDNLINNMTTNPILKALSKTPNVVSNLSNMGGTSSNDKNYYFSNFTVQANDIEQFISSIETIIPMKNN